MSKKHRRVIHRAPEIAERDGGWLCRYCHIALIPTTVRIGHPDFYIGLQPAPDRMVEIKAGYAECQVDHLVAKSRGGSDDLSNLVLACVQCNQLKGAKSEAEYLAWLRSRAE